MKKVTSFIAVVLCALTLFSCAKDTVSQQTDTQQPQQTEADAQTQAQTTPEDTAEETTPETEGETTEDYIAYLMGLGFPKDYAQLLEPLHKRHPEWQFNPIKITDLSNGKYTWNYVIEKEIEDDENNTVYYTLSDAMDYAIDDKLVESGIWFRAKRESVEFFMDPRNFLTENNIFMFENLQGDVTDSTLAVECLLDGTFMFRANMGDNGSNMKYSECFVEVGKKVGISPLMIAARLRQEQGVSGTSALISGTCGNTLWEYYSNQTNSAPESGYSEGSLKAYNGYYNFFNIEATGTGRFATLLAGMKEAQNGGWTSRYKAIEGGATKVKSRYIDDFQQTLYFQKFNIDPRSHRNFWGQYMQAIHAAYDEGRSTFNAYRRANLLNNPFVFDIPVFEGMPESPCPDPGTRYS